MQNSLFCFGYGYTCDYLGHALSREGWDIAGTTRDVTKRNTLKQRGISSYIFDYEMPLYDPLMILDQVTHLLISTPPDSDGDPAFLMHAHDIRHLPNLKWVGYLSTTGVYGNRNGEWVNENNERAPSSKRGSRRVLAENQWIEMMTDHGIPLHIFRLSGIYGPGRSALDSVRAGTARCILKPGHAFSRMHVEDIVQVLIKSMMNPNPGQIYNLADDMPASSCEVITYACQLLNRKPPPIIPYEQADLAPITRSFYEDNKRISNEKIKNDLGINLIYPTYKEGLKACLDAEYHAMNDTFSKKHFAIL